MTLLNKCKWCGKTVIEGFGERNYCSADHNIRSIEFCMSQLERDYEEDHNDWIKGICSE